MVMIMAKIEMKTGMPDAMDMKEMMRVILIISGPPVRMCVYKTMPAVSGNVYNV